MRKNVELSKIDKKGIKVLISTNSYCFKVNRFYNLSIPYCKHNIKLKLENHKYKNTDPENTVLIRKKCIWQSLKAKRIPLGTRLHSILLKILVDYYQLKNNSQTVRGRNYYNQQRASFALVLIASNQIHAENLMLNALNSQLTILIVGTLNSGHSLHE